MAPPAPTADARGTQGGAHKTFQFLYLTEYIFFYFQADASPLPHGTSAGPPLLGLHGSPGEGGGMPRGGAGDKAQGKAQEAVVNIRICL